ncbi:YesK family protein [Priestia flexa]|uniref:YesK family protein n=1 Tax=Priestia flexa TaxID=86664 RepID=UPI000C242B6A|nr:YesK family protein [Priestia flexa]MEC0666262.1 YesK family protein [Priestia flexa]
MMLFAPFLASIVPGIIILLLTWWFKKKNFSFSVRLAPGIIGIVGAILLFYIGFVNIRGFEGIAYGILSFFLIVFAFVALIIGRKPKHTG